MGKISKLNGNSENIRINGYVATWYVIDTAHYKGKKVFLLENEEYGDEMPCIIVDENRKVLHNEVYNGFSDLYENAA